MKISKKIAKLLTEEMFYNNIIGTKELCVFSYCYEYLFDQIICLLVMFAISVFFHQLTIFLLSLITFLPLRTFGGGIHASNEKVCICLSFALYVSTLIIFPKIALIDNGLCTLVMSIFIPIDIFIAPVDTKNKRLTTIQKKSLKRKFIYVCLFIIVADIILHYTKSKIYYVSLSLYVILTSISMFIGAITNMKAHVTLKETKTCS